MPKIITLEKPYTAGPKTFNTITLREPTYVDIYMEGIGEPQELQPGPNGKPMIVTYPSAIDAYLAKLIVEPGYEYISGLSVADSKKLAETVIDFFRSGKAEQTQPTS